MKQGRPPKDIAWEDKDSIRLKMSFNQIKCLLLKLRNYRTNSVEGGIKNSILRDLQHHLMIEIKNGRLPMSVTKKISESIDEKNNDGSDS